MAKSPHDYAEWEEGIKKHIYCVNSFTLNSRKRKLIYRVRKQTSACLGLGTTKGGLQRGVKKLLEVMVMFIILITVMVSCQFYTLNTFSLLHFNYTSIKFFLKE